ncbi:amino acid/amide ABC transporter substrate-binding protein, HAAT family [Bradyrhizobium sp. Rc2d]|uniref:ABC transporter substrate-binding protein n=1 Tax=Bradyrhizobium sp. Rc2d TaxID=1855321 RepID=UPI00087E1123|nr:ABC transporter substrate-binding protein [Bradyrhizobium sp. Rc2d]SDI26466.1 amino acid/amide ABC transporter substrate-binding protein, HAAT family [Bradyrhizobium sp. Rc2d]
MKNRIGNGLTRRTVLGSGLGIAAGLVSWPVRAVGQVKVKIGAIMPSSGVLAFPGQACVRGIDLGAKFARQKYGDEIEVIHADTQSRPENGRIAAENLIRQGCTVLIGAWDSGATISALQACEAAKVPMVVHIASATQVTSQGFTQVFRYYPTSLMIIRQSLIDLKALLTTLNGPPASAVVLHLNNVMGQSSATSIAQAWKEVDLPIKLTEFIPYDEKAKDLSVEVAKAKATGADMLFPITRVNDAIMITRECVKQGWSPKMIYSANSNGVIDKAYYDALGKYADGAMASALYYNPKAPDAHKILEMFAADYPNEWLDANAACAFEAVQIVRDAVNRAGSSESGAIHGALKLTEMQPVLMSSGTIKFDSSGQNVNSAVALLQAQKGKPRVVSPRAIAEADLEYPVVPFSSR